MKLSLCTISFRHTLVSLDNLATWGNRAGFDGIELWGAHARSLAASAEACGMHLRNQRMEISMLSDYVNFEQSNAACLEAFHQTLALASRWNTPKVRLFAGNRASHLLKSEDRIALARKMRMLADAAADQGIQLLLETHPNTFLDRMKSTEWFLDQVNHMNLKINFDVLHVWEAGDDPVAALNALGNKVAHMHFKNVKSRAALADFEPGNVFSPNGRRDGMVPLFKGAFDYDSFFAKLRLRELDLSGSLEWFGNPVLELLASDAMEFRNCWNRHEPRLIESSI